MTACARHDAELLARGADNWELPTTKSLPGAINSDSCEQLKTHSHQRCGFLMWVTALSSHPQFFPSLFDSVTIPPSTPHRANLQLPHPHSSPGNPRFARKTPSSLISTNTLEQSHVARGLSGPHGGIRCGQGRLGAPARADPLHLRRLRPQVDPAPGDALPAVQGLRVPYPVQGADEEVRSVANPGIHPCVQC